MTLCVPKTSSVLVDERIGYPGGMIALILFVLGILASPFKAKSRLRRRMQRSGWPELFQESPVQKTGQDTLDVR